MKRAILICILCISLSGFSEVLAQGNSQRAKDKKENKNNNDRNDKGNSARGNNGKKGNPPGKSDEKKNNRGETEDSEDAKKESNGNAFGKNKGDLKGKAFGQARAEQAKLNSEEKRKNLDKTISDKEQIVNEAKQKIKEKRQKLEEKRSTGQIPAADYAREKGKIEVAERKLKELEDKIAQGKSKRNKSTE